MALSLRKKQLGKLESNPPFISLSITMGVCNNSVSDPDLITRMLHLNQQQSSPDGGGEGEEEAYKILVMDGSCISLLSPVLRVGDLRKHGVTLHLNIDKARQQVADAPAVYLVRPTPANADRIAADAAAGLYASFHIN